MEKEQKKRTKDYDTLNELNDFERGRKCLATKRVLITLVRGKSKQRRKRREIAETPPPSNYLEKGGEKKTGKICRREESGCRRCGEDER